ncbi:MAG: SRPBCC family protein [Candidatus Promineifilaceae bacterium]
MARLERSIVINGTAAEIDAITSDGNRLPEWYAGIMKASSDGVFPEPGGKVEMAYKSAGITFDMSQTSLEYEPEKGGKYKMEGMLTGIYEEIIEPVEEGTRFTLKFDYEMPGGGVGKLVDKLVVERMNTKNLEDSLDNLKALVEG